VCRLPHVAVIPTGTELVEVEKTAEQDLKPGNILGSY
jgi:molybdopterin biosynthesis enzyme